MNLAYHDMVYVRVLSAINTAIALTQVKHSGLKGQLREVVVRDLFRPLLSVSMGAGTGEVVAANGLHSLQQDVLLYDRSILPPVVLEEAYGLFPIESVLYSIEIKTRLTKQELKKSHESAKNLQTFPYMHGKRDNSGALVQHQISRVVNAILCFDSALSAKKSIVEHYDDIRGSDAPAITVFCVVGVGYWYWGVDAQGTEVWISWPQNYPFQEVMGFVGGVMNSLVKISSTRGFPALGHYFL